MDDADITRQIDRAFGRYGFRRDLNDLKARKRRFGALSAPRFAVAGAIVLAVAAWAGLSSPAAGPTLAFAGWQPVPDAQNSSFAEAAAARCHVGGEKRRTAQDQRGSAAVFVYAGGTELTLCLVARDSTGAIVAAASGSTHLEPANGALSVDTGLSAPATSQSTGVRIMAGRASAPIASVVVARTDGVEVTATVSSGYWVAWWPTTTNGTTVTGMDSQGAVVQVAPALN